MSSQPLIGEIMPAGFNFNPRGWEKCHGQLLSISSNTALFSLLGTTFGGDGRTTFALPDLRGRTMVGEGDGPGLTVVRLGEKGGQQSVTLDVANMPAHSHTPTLHGEKITPTSNNPDGNMLAGHSGYAPDDGNAANNKTMNAASIVSQTVGGNQSFNNRSPYLGLTICIAMTGIYPSRN